jgi:hypothetical protein
MNSYNQNKKRFTPGQFLGALAALFLGIVTVAYAVSIPNIFTSGTTISSGAVNANFTALNAGLPLMWAHTDNDTGGTTVTASGVTEVNSVSINIPASGFITISGMVFINNAGVAADFVLNPKVDGVDVLGHGSQGFLSAAANGAGVAELFSLSYTLTVPISAGAHTVSQVAGPQSTTLNFFYNRNNLTVTYFPASQGSVTPAITPLTPGSNEGSVDGR